MGAAWYRARGELRLRWRTTLLLVALVGLAGGVLLTTIAGARRSSTAYDRLRAETLAADLDIVIDGDPAEHDPEALDAVLSLPQIEVATRTAFPFVVPADSGMYPYLDFLAIVGLDDQFSVTIDRPRVIHGRVPDPEAPDEVAILDIYAREADLEVGDVVELESYDPGQMEPLFTGGDAGAPAGPRVELRVVGILDAPTFLSESVGSFVPRAFLSAAFHEEHAEDIAAYPGGITVRLRNGQADVPAVSREVREIYADQPLLELQPASEVDSKIESSIDVVVGALVVSALIAGLAGSVAIGQALARHFGQDASGARGLAALGMTRRQRVVALAATAVPIAVGGALLAAVLSILASVSMPVGAARRAEPDPGVSVDGWVLGIGTVAIVGLVLLLALLAAIPAARRTRAAERADATRTVSRSLRAVRQTSLPPAATVGLGLALDPRDGTAWSVRSALAGVAFGAAGLVAVVVLSASLSSLVDTPARYGAPWHGIVSGFGGEIVEELSDGLIADPDVERLSILQVSLGHIGDDDLNLHAIEGVKGDPALTLLAGRLPTEPGEVVFGASTMRDLGAGIGDEVELEGIGTSLPVTIVGKAAFPVVDERSSVGRGALLVEGDLAKIVTEDSINHDFLIGWKDGVEPGAANRALAERAGVEVSSPRLPAEVNNLREIDALPRTLAVFLALLAALVVVHALVSTVRVRRHDLAVLRALGFERSQLGAVLAWQASAIATIGLVVGVVAGLVAGRLVWRAAAADIGVVDDPSAPTLVVVLIAIGVLLVANVAAAAPARLARRVRPAAALRAS